MTVLAVGDGSSTLLRPKSTEQPNGQLLPLVLGSNTITANAQSQYLIGSQTLVLGSSITIGRGSSTTVLALSMNSKGVTVFAVGSSTFTFSASSSQGVGDYIIGGIGKSSANSTGNSPIMATTSDGHSLARRELLAVVFVLLLLGLANL